VVAAMALPATLVDSALAGRDSTCAPGRGYRAGVIALGLAAFARFMSGARARWVGCQPDVAQRIYFANHTSHMDAIVIWSVLPPAIRDLTRPVAARDYWNAGRIRRYLATREFHAVLIERGITSYHHNPVDDLVEAMGTRHSLIFFPEGQRGPGPEPGPFRSGLFHLAERHPASTWFRSISRTSIGSLKGALVPVRSTR
jgi:1-acyl-sn-glycerol-3-phosphate acyltransferase